MGRVGRVGGPWDRRVALAFLSAQAVTRRLSGATLYCLLGLWSSVLQFVDTLRKIQRQKWRWIAILSYVQTSSS